MQQNDSESEKSIDAYVRIVISEDEVEARLYIDPPQEGGAEIQPGMIDEAIKREKIKFGLIEETVERAKKRPLYGKEFLIAKGIAPVNGENGSLEYQFKTSTDTHPKELENGKVDFRDLGIIENVKKDQILCVIKKATNGTEGTSVTGKKLLPVNGIPVDSPQGSNTLYNEDQTELRSSVNGYVSLTGYKVNVIETFFVGNDVDNSTGNIKFIGNVNINGNVLEGFTVEADGDVTVGGVVEAANIKSGGNITIRNGVVGRYSSKLECKGNLSSIFLENCEINAGGSVKAENIMNCNIKCVGSIELTGSRSKIIGGQCIAGKNITAGFIGSPANLPTELVIGSAPELVIKQSALLKEIKQLEQQIDKLGKIVTLLKQYEAANKLPPSKAKVLQDSIFSLNKSGVRYEEAKKELEDVNKAIEETGKGVVTCYDTIYRGVRMTIGGAILLIEQATMRSKFTNVKGEIVAKKN